MARSYYGTFLLWQVQTLDYRSPEVAYGLPFGHPIDMWSLGVSLAELYSGVALLHASTRGGLAVQATAS